MIKYINIVFSKITPNRNLQKKEEDFGKICDSLPFKLRELDESQLLKTIDLSEKSLDETNKAFDSNTRKSTIIIGFLISGCIGLLSYFFNQNEFSINSQFSPFLFSVFVTSLILFLLSIYLSQNLETGTWYKSGALPSSFLQKDFIDKKASKQDYKLYNSLLLNQIRNYERNINFNENKNGVVSSRINISLYLFIRTPLAFLLIYVISHLIYYLLSLCFGFQYQL